ncbi:histidine kinase [Actinotalea sp. JY-7876]|uniref:histidine kinase n=1 Tax=Actinotalea sp. JY-7876 TaxID=2758442 RepID=UPI0015F751BF|nr:histidine kinase [Actinotalea sp. JY-7876]
MSQTPQDPQRPAPDEGAPTPAELARAREGRVRRAPRYRRFVQVGVLLGALVGVLLVLLGPDVPTELGRGPVTVFVGLTGALVGALAGAVVAVVADRRSTR